MTPAQRQFNVHVLFRAGMLPILTVGEPGVQGAGVLGIQGCGVSTPWAAAVAAATCGLARDVHIAKGMTLVIGMLSIMVAAGILLVFTRFFGGTTNELGAVPKLQDIIAPIQTACGIE